MIPAPTPAEHIDDWYCDDQDDECPYCGGEGVTYDCFDGQCLDAEEGCDLCARRCDHCRPVPAVQAARPSEGPAGAPAEGEQAREAKS